MARATIGSNLSPPPNSKAAGIRGIRFGRLKVLNEEGQALDERQVGFDHGLPLLRGARLCLHVRRAGLPTHRGEPNLVPSRSVPAHTASELFFRALLETKKKNNHPRRPSIVPCWSKLLATVFSPK